jgi:hypothetical protein
MLVELAQNGERVISVNSPVKLAKNDLQVNVSCAV